MRARVRTRSLRGDEGSILPLAAVLAALALAVVLICADATSLHLAQKRLDAVADAAALAAADGFVLDTARGQPVAVLTDHEVRAQAEAIVEASEPGARVIAAWTPDGTSARVTVAADWRPPVLTLFVPDAVALEATATSRTALR